MTRVPMLFLARLALLLPVWVGAVAAHAGARDAVTVARPPEDRGAAFVPGTRALAGLPGPAYVEEEFFVSGRASVFSYAHNPPLGPADTVEIASGVPYRTRLIVRRPEQPEDFNGTLVIEWWNSTAGFDTAPVWDQSANYFTRRGIAYVGVTNSTTSIGFLSDGCRGFGALPPTCGTRYATLDLPENGLAYEMMSQLAVLLRRGGAENPLPPAFEVKRLFHAGESQQAGSVITYASAFHLPRINDGYFVQSNINARPINFGPACGTEGAPAFPACTPRLAYPHQLVRTDLPVPVYQVITQTDFETLGFTNGRQPDTRFFRYYEVAGGAHNVVHRNVQLVPAGVLRPGPVLLEDLCREEINSTTDGPVFVAHVLNALWTRMAQQADEGKRPPAGQVMDLVDGVLARDARGNVTGGVRVPALEVPVATYVSGNVADPDLPPALAGIGSLVCRLSGSVFPLDAETLGALYPNHRQYLKQVKASVATLQEQGLLLRADAAAIVRAAERSGVGRN